MSSGEEIFGRIFEKDGIVFRQGDSGNNMFIIQSGSVEVSRKDKDGKESVLAILEKDDFFGEMAIMQDDERSATVKALQHTRLLPLTKESLVQRIRTDPGVALHLIEGLLVRIQRTNENLRIKVEENDELRTAVTENRPEQEESSAVSAKENPEGEHTSSSVEDLSASDLARLWNVEDALRSYSENHRVFDEGDPGNEMFIIVEGAVRISQGKGEDERILSVLGAGDFFGEAAIITNAGRSASAVVVENCKLLPIGREEFSDRLKKRPEIALFIIQTLIRRLKQRELILEDPDAAIDEMRKSWQPLLRKDKIKVAIVSLSTCAGCSAVLLDDRVLKDISEHADIVYCPMLMDSSDMVEADLALIDGLVRLEEEQEKLHEARMKSKYLVAWGTCAVYGGIPEKANRFELEELIEETYGHTKDAFAYYLSGKSGVDAGVTYQEQGVTLLRQAYRVDNFSRVDYYLPGCPPQAGLLLQLVDELVGSEIAQTKAIVCAECPRKPTKDPVQGLSSHVRHDADPFKCFTSMGTLCLGFTIKGGCGALCTSNGMPCWGCRGPSSTSYKKMFEGLSFEEVLASGLSKRCKLPEDAVRETVREMRKQGHGLYQFNHNVPRNLPRFR